MADIAVSDIVRVVQGSSDANSGSISGVSIDSRKIAQGNLYVAIQGERMDGHDFAADALANGAYMVMTQRPVTAIPTDKQIVVGSTLDALQQLAAWQRARSEYKVIGVTGSVGKTTAKDMLACVIARQASIYATQGNYNNHLGLPLTILNAPDNLDYLVLEMGMNHAGEIALLSRIARPDVAIITVIDAVHIEHFESVEGIARAKAEIVEGMSAGGLLVIPADTPYHGLLNESALSHSQHVLSFGKNDHADYRLTHINVSTTGTQAVYEHNHTEYPITIGAAGAHYALNALAVLAVCSALPLDSQLLADAFIHVTEPKGRGNIRTIDWKGGKLTVIDESYNASPVAMRAAIARARALAGEQRVIAVLGDMLELGHDAPAYHASLAEPLREYHIDSIYCVGSMMLHLAQTLHGHPSVHYFVHNDACVNALSDALQPGDIMLVKGSRGSKMEQVIEGLVEYV